MDRRLSMIRPNRAWVTSTSGPSPRQPSATYPHPSAVATATSSIIRQKTATIYSSTPVPISSPSSQRVRVTVAAVARRLTLVAADNTLVRSHGVVASGVHHLWLRSATQQGVAAELIRHQNKCQRCIVEGRLNRA